MEVKVKQEVLEDIRKSLLHRNKSAVRIDLEGFG